MAEPSDPIERASLGPGVIVGDRYRIVEQLGEGGMGKVFRATHLTLQHDIAIKFLDMGGVTPGARARFEREARIAARLGEATRHIARVIDYGVFRGTVPYLCMELLRGETLSQRLRHGARLPLNVAARIVVQLCRALQVAHGAGVIHRDMKPSNVFLSRTDLDQEILVKLMDFGIAKSTVEADGDETTSIGTIIGTPAYMSPEQLLCKKLDARTDLWSVAAVVYRMVCGRSPFGQGGIAELGLRILATEPLAPSKVVEGLPPAFDAWMAKGMSRNPEERFQSARDLADALAAIALVDAGTEPSGMQTPLPDRLPLAIADSEAIELPSDAGIECATSEERPTPHPRSRRWIGRAALGAAAALVSAIFGLAWSSRAQVPHAVASAPETAPSEVAPHETSAQRAAKAAPANTVATKATFEELEAKPAPTASAAPTAPAAPTKKATTKKPKSGAKPASSAPGVEAEAAQLWTNKDEL